MADDGAGSCIGCLSFVSFAFLITIIVLSAQIYNLTETDPVLHPFESNIAKYLSNEEDLHFKYNYGKHCQCGEEIINDFCSEEQILKGCFDVSLNKDKLSLRRLYDCTELTKIVGEEDDLSKVFKLNFDMVHKMALGILIINVIVLASIIFIIFVSFGVACCPEALVVCVPFLFIVGIAIALSGLVNLIILIIMMVNYYQGKTTGDLLDYIDCVKEPDKDIFKKMYKYDDLDSLDSKMTALVTISFINIVINCITSIVNGANKKE